MICCMQRITISIADEARSKLKRLAGDRSESEYARELLEAAMRQEEVRRMADQLRNLPAPARRRGRTIERAMRMLRGF
jgi:predicted CopG family antitoxin